MLTKSKHSLKDVADGLLKPLSKTELKLALSDLQKIGKTEAAVGELLKAEGPLRDFITAALTLSPYLRDIANVDPSILCAAIVDPLEPQIETLIAQARDAWRPATDTPPQCLNRRLTRLTMKIHYAQFHE